MWWFIALFVPFIGVIVYAAYLSMEKQEAIENRYHGSTYIDPSGSGDGFYVSNNNLNSDSGSVGDSGAGDGGGGGGD